ncbi:membrane protein [Deinococcus radiotolerans]|uniref:Membrane protein n=2 Tax=Deinococcus radiotolerans TaxID=1309407 RepID=A0ABQ2FJQ0_9DEIO|nr:membrane protein [Deinococcus radiotolerans]
MTLAGVGHLSFQRQAFQAQVPTWLPVNKDAVVLASGAAEIAFGLAMLSGARRRQVGLALAAFFVAIFPGNVSQYVSRQSAFGLDTDRKRLVRLLFQPLLVAWALWSTGALRSTGALGRAGARRRGDRPLD